MDECPLVVLGCQVPEFQETNQRGPGEFWAGVCGAFVVLEVLQGGPGDSVEGGDIDGAGFGEGRRVGGEVDWAHEEVLLREHGHVVGCPCPGLGTCNDVLGG